MKKMFLSLGIGLLVSSSALATEITPENIVGRYKAEINVVFTRYYLNLRVVDTKDFEIQRTYPDGRKDESCNGTYSIGPNLFREGLQVLVGKSFKGSFSCPSDRSRTNSFNINFGDKKVEDLVNGTSVTVTTSAAPGRRLSAYIKKL